MLFYPGLSLFILTIAPFLGFAIVYNKAYDDEDRLGKAMRGLGMGLLIDIPIICVLLITTTQ